MAVAKVPTINAERAHALLSASAAERWLNCPPSARLEETLPDTESDYAKEGTLAHSLAELKLTKYITLMTKRTFNTRRNKLKKDPLWDDEMDKHTETYMDYIKGTAHSFPSPPHIIAEKKVNYSNYAPEGFGTSDCIIIGGDTLYIIDFKYGKGKAVFAEDNSQMKLYALGAINAYRILYSIEKVILVIVQPRKDSISQWEISSPDLLAWGESIKPIAQMAFDGKGEFVSGDHCQFCRAKSQCRARSEFNTSIENHNKAKPPLITNEEVGQILIKYRNYAKWLKDLENYALAECINGNEIPGWKAVEGRSNRAFTDTDKAFELLKTNGIDEAVLYERKPITLTAVEKLLGKKDFNDTLSNYIEKPPGKPTLVQESDKREAIKNQITPEEAFKN